MDLKAILEKQEEQLKDWYQFKKDNDARLQLIEKSGRADPLLAEKVEKQALALGEQEKQIRALETKANALGATGAATETVAQQHSKAFGAFIRKGKEDGLADLQVRAMSLTAGEGGYTIPQDLDNTIGKMARQAAPMLTEVSSVDVSTETYEEPVVDGMSVSAWAAETGARAASTAPTFVKWTPSYGEIWANPQVTQRMLEDAKFNVEQFLAEDIGESFGIGIDTAIISGSGTNQPKGILSHTIAQTADATRAYGTIERVHSGTAGDFAANALISLAYTLRPAYRQGAKFAAAALTWAKIRQFKDATSGQYLWQPGLAGGQPPTLLGYACIEDENVPAVAASAYSVIFGNFQRAFRLVNVVGTTMLRDPYSAKPYVHFYTRKRVGGGVRDTRAVKLLYLAV